MKKIILFISLVVLLASCQVLPPSQPTVTQTFASTLITPTATIKPVNKYHDSILGFSLDYPNTWKEVGVRRLKGDDGYLTISELPDYHSLSADHVCSDYVYKNLRDKVYSLVRFGGLRGCIILQTPYAEKPKSGDKMFGIFRRYNPKTYEYDYFLLESTYPYFMKITSSLVFDKDSLVPDTLSLFPQPFESVLNGLRISETFIKAANFNGEDWNLQGLSVSDKNRNYSKTTHCGNSIMVDGHTLVINQLDDENTGTNLIEVKEDKNVIFNINIFQSPSSYVWVFCEWNNSWFLETSDFIVQNGEILNHKLGYDEMFGWQILAGKPFYFFTKNGVVYLSYNGEVLPTEYNYVPHYGCCEAGTSRNPHGNDNEVWFFGTRNGAWYYVDVNAK